MHRRITCLALLMALACSMALFASSVTAIPPVPPKEACWIEGLVKKVRAGSYQDAIYDTSGPEPEFKPKTITYTELLIHITQVEPLRADASVARECAQDIVDTARPYGLCEEQTIVAGDRIRARNDGWGLAPECLHHVTFIQK